MINFKKLKDSYDQQDAAICTVRLQNFNPDTIIKNIGYEDRIIENSVYYSDIQKLEPTVLGSSDFKIKGYVSQSNGAPGEFNTNWDFLVTQKTNSNNEPLFYEYQLKFDAYGLTDQDMVQVYKNNVELVDRRKYKLEFGSQTFKSFYLSDPNSTHMGRYHSSIEWGDFDNTTTIHRIRILFPIDFYDEDAFYTVRYVKRLYDINDNVHSELVELDRLYGGETNTSYPSIWGKPSSYNISYDTLSVIPSIIDPANITFLYIVRNPATQVKHNGLVQLLTDGSQKEADASWNLRVNTGTFITGDTTFDTTTSKYQVSYEADPDYIFQLMSYIKPRRFGTNIFKIDQNPIHINNEKYIYPDYRIETLYTTSGNDLPIGGMGFNLDNDIFDGFKIASIDRCKGYILINKSIPVEQDFSIFAYVDMRSNIYIRNFEFNPRLPGRFGISTSADNTIKDVGIAIRRTKITVANNERREYFHPYFFDYAKPTKFYRAEVSPSEALPVAEIDGALVWNPYTSESDPDGEFLPIALLTLNELSPDLLKIDDARTINGGIHENFTNTLTNHQINSYVDKGYWDGEILPHAGLHIIHIPRQVYIDLVNRWINSDMFNKDLYTDITQYEIEQFAENSPEHEYYYSQLLEGVTSQGDQAYEPYQKMLERWAEHEASRYLDQIIRKYISAGSQYVLMDEDFKVIKLRLEE